MTRRQKLSKSLKFALCIMACFMVLDMRAVAKPDGSSNAAAITGVMGDIGASLCQVHDKTKCKSYEDLDLCLADGTGILPFPSDPNWCSKKRGKITLDSSSLEVCTCPYVMNANYLFNCTKDGNMSQNGKEYCVCDATCKLCDDECLGKTNSNELYSCSKKKGKYIYDSNIDSPLCTCSSNNCKLVSEIATDFFCKMEKGKVIQDPKAKATDMCTLVLPDCKIHETVFCAKEGGKWVEYALVLLPEESDGSTDCEAHVKKALMASKKLDVLPPSKGSEASKATLHHAVANAKDVCKKK